VGDVVATTAKSLTVKYVGDDTALRKTMSDIARQHDTLSSKLKNLGSSMMSVGKTMTAGITLPLVGMGKVALDEFTQLQQVNKQTATVLKSTGGEAGVTMDHIHELSASLGNLSVQDAETVQSTENLLLTFTNLQNEVGKGNDIFDQTSLAVQDMSASLGQDAKSSAIQLGKALNDPLVGLTALSRVGVAFTADQKIQIKTLMEHNDLLGAQKIVLGEVTKEFGGSAKAMGKTASPMTRLNLAFRDMAESLGQTLAPIIESIAKWLSTLFDRFKTLSPGVKKVIVVAGLLAAVLGPLLIVLGAVASAIGTITLPVLAVIAVVALLAFAVIKNWGAIKRVTLAVWGWLKTYIGPVISGIITVVKTAMKVLLGIWKAEWTVIKSVLQEVWSIIKVLVVNRIKDILSFLRPELHFIAEVWKTAWGGMKDVFGAIWRGLLAVAQPVMNGLIFLINGVIHGINALIHAWNLIPGHGDIPTIATLTKLGSDAAAAAGSGIRGHAKGGIFTRPTIGLIGEAGPEAVIPLNRMRGMGGTIVVNVYNAGSVVTERELTESVRAGLIKVARRNGGNIGF
jgi:hypothetical protein